MVQGVRRIEVENYRSLRRVSVDLGRATVVSGANGAGKSSLYRAVELLRAAAAGDLARSLAAEGGMGSALWRGRRRKGAVQIRLAVDIDHLRYELTLGLPRPTDAALTLDPVVKAERVTAEVGGRRVRMLERTGPQLSARDPSGRMRAVDQRLWLFETALSALVDPERYPELAYLRGRLLDARFYDSFRVDKASPLRAPQPMISSPNMDSDGANWAGALYSRLAIADGFRDIARSPITTAIAAAFPGSELRFEEMGGALDAGLVSPEFDRPFAARELSDGTVRYLALVAALLALRPPAFIALNEPETSLHVDLIDPLADLIGAAALETQILVVTHNAALADRLEVEHGALARRLVKEDGETQLVEN